jgi:pSer/pThr/pTyr-binding forkhead associated (FHA) protein
MSTITPSPVFPKLAPPPHATDLTVGRSSDNDIVLRTHTVSRHHARVHREGDEWLVEDTGSTNGTAINGEPVREPTHLEAGDVVMFGGAMLRFDPNGR